LEQLIAVAAATEQEGLPSEAAAIKQISVLRTRYAQTMDQTAADALDARANALFLDLAHDFALGRTDAAHLDPTWHLKPEKRDFSALRAQALAANDIASTLRALLPQSAEYMALKSQLAQARAETSDAHVTTLRANMERLRWAPRAIARDRVEVRIPFFTLTRYVADARVAEHKVIVGKPSTPTPSFAASIDAITLNPYWTPPTSITKNELLPALRRDPDAANRLGYEIRDKSGALIDPRTIGAGGGPYTIRQVPGPANALGSIKFEVSDPYAIYIHDTPSKALFDENKRAFSHGCIRLQAPVDMAAALAPPSFAGILPDLIATGENKTIALDSAVPVYVLYLTTALDDEGAVIYAEDIYRRDARIVRALDKETRQEPVPELSDEAALTGLDIAETCGA
jgi:murein L,D-transpeptidase YcbB/YkuD